ncbi:MAG: hypothetical protein ACSW8C_01500 [bacterium]
MRISLIIVVFLLFLLEFSNISNAVSFTLPEGKKVSFTTGKFALPKFEPNEKKYLKECDEIISNEDKHDQVIFYVAGIEEFIKKLGKWESITNTNCKLRVAGLCIKRTELLKISEQPFNWKSDPIIPTTIGNRELNIGDDIRQCYESCYIFFKNLKENISEEGCKDEYKEWASEYLKQDESELTPDERSVVKCMKKMFP